MIPALEMYRIAFYVMAAAALGFLAWIWQKPAGTRRFYLPIPIVCGILSLAYFGMSMEMLHVSTPDGQPVYMTRYIEYFTTAVTMVVVAGMIAGATRRQIGALVVVVVSWIGSILASYFTTPPTSIVVNVLTLVLFGVIAYLMVGPITKRSGATSGERVVLYGKLRNLILLLWIAYLVLGLITRQGMGLLDAFGGIFLGAYLDVATRIGFGILLLRAPEAIEQVIAQSESDDGPDEPDSGNEVTFGESSVGEPDADVEPAD